MSAPTTPRPVRTGPRFPGATVLRDGHVIYWWGEVLAILAFYGIYSTIRNATNTDPALAYSHARNIIHWEQLIGIFHEQALEKWALHSSLLIDAMNYVYGSLHFVVTAGTGVFLYRNYKDDYPRWRNTLGVATAIALVGFYTWPLMPPRLLNTMPGGAHYGFVDTLAKYPTAWSFNSGAISKLSNQFAAMPSVHCAWALWCACALVPRVRARWAKVLAALYPCLTVTAIVLTANHYFLDAVAGFITLGMGYVVARLVTRAGRGPAISTTT